MSLTMRHAVRMTMAAVALAASALAVAADKPAPGGLYVGYYQEDPASNPEDPMPGAFVLKLPDSDAAFSGAMFFTYVGCQTSNVGNVKGIKAGNALGGTWSGTIDGSPQSGPYQGSFDPAAAHYKGSYSNAGGKQFRDIKGCVQYHIAPNGSWEMFPVEQSQPAAFHVNVASSHVTWPTLPGAAMALVYVIDPALASLSGSSNPVKYQTVLPGGKGDFNLATLGLSKGKEYVVVALVSNRKAQRIGFTSQRFIAP